VHKGIVMHCADTKVKEEVQDLS
jgi:hypothetical protein